MPEWLLELKPADWLTGLLALGTLGLMVATFLLYLATARAARDAAVAAESSKHAADVALEQLKLAKAYNEAELLVRMDEVFQRPEFARLFGRLLGVGDLGKNHDKPISESDWTDLIPYIGALERLNLIRQTKLVRIDWLEPYYGFNVEMLVRQSDVRRRLKENASSWRKFIELWHTFEVQKKGAHDSQGIECLECKRQ